MRVDLEDARFVVEELVAALKNLANKVEKGTATVADATFAKGVAKVGDEKLSIWMEMEAEERAESREASASHWAELPYTIDGDR